MTKWSNSKLKWLLLVHLLLSDVVFARAPLPPQNHLQLVTSKISKESQTQPAIMGLTSAEKPINKKIDSPVVLEEEHNRHPAHQLISDLSASLQGQLHLHLNASCAELLTGGWRGNSFSQELLGLAMVPVLVSAGCSIEAQELIMKLYTELGQEDTRELLEDVLMLIKRAKDRNENRNPSPFNIPSSESQRHLQALIFNINQLAGLENSSDSYEGNVSLRGQCKGWVRVKGTQLLGQAAEQGKPLCLTEAQQVCQSLAFHCAGVTQDGNSSPGYYRVILRRGSRVVPSSSSDSWIQNCETAPVRWRRDTVPRPNCVNKNEEQVYTVVEWIPAVSTLYNLGTAVYYASVNCFDTAKERAIYSTVDLGTDALMAVTGGTAGVAGYALGAGLKTSVKAGVKYLLNSMKEDDDLLMNQNSWEDGTFNIE